MKPKPDKAEPPQVKGLNDLMLLAAIVGDGPTDFASLKGKQIMIKVKKP